MKEAVERYLDDAEEAAETPFAHRAARAALVAVGSLAAGALLEKGYNRFVLSDDEDDTEEATSEDQE